jgi:hypothetical protein
MAWASLRFHSGLHAVDPASPGVMPSRRMAVVEKVEPAVGIEPTTHGLQNKFQVRNACFVESNGVAEVR